LRTFHQLGIVSGLSTMTRGWFSQNGSLPGQKYDNRRAADR
jgi:hypothetical protein